MTTLSPASAPVKLTAATAHAARPGQFPPLAVMNAEPYQPEPAYEPTAADHAEAAAIFAGMDFPDRYEDEAFELGDDAYADEAESDDLVRGCLAGHDDGPDWDRDELDEEAERLACFDMSLLF